MKKLLLVLIVGGLGYWIGTGAAATEWKAFGFWSENRAVFPMLAARANWVLSELEASSPEIETPPTTHEEMRALAEELAKGNESAAMPRGLPSYHRAKIEEHRDRSAEFTSYAKIREAAQADDFSRMEQEHLSMLGERLDGGHVLTVWHELATIRIPSPDPLAGEIRESLIWMTAVNLSTRERIASAPYIRQLPSEGEIGEIELGVPDEPPADPSSDDK